MSAIGLVKPGDDRKPPGDHYGTGSFITFNNQRYILTCGHVATRKKLGTLGFTQFDAEEGLSIANSFDCMPYPIDGLRHKGSRRTARALFMQITAQGYRGGYNRVTEFIRTWRAQVRVGEFNSHTLKYFKWGLMCYLMIRTTQK